MPKTFHLTYQHLTKLHACDEQKFLFHKFFPDGVTLTECDMYRLVSVSLNAGLDFKWLIQKTQLMRQSHAMIDIHAIQGGQARYGLLLEETSIAEKWRITDDDFRRRENEVVDTLMPDIVKNLNLMFYEPSLYETLGAIITLGLALGFSIVSVINLDLSRSVTSDTVFNPIFFVVAAAFFVCYLTLVIYMKKMERASEQLRDF